MEIAIAVGVGLIKSLAEVIFKAVADRDANADQVMADMLTAVGVAEIEYENLKKLKGDLSFLDEIARKS